LNTWLFDLGNSRLKLAPLHDGIAGEGSVGDVIAIGHDGTRFEPGWRQRLPQAFDVACVAAVAPAALTLQLLDALTAHCARIVVARTEPALAGVRIAYAQPHRLGVDRFLAMLAARARTARPALVVGVGTALTVDLLDAGGVHRGGRIAASPALMRAALHARTAVLPAEGGDYAAFAVDTPDALASGCEGAALGLLAHSMDAAAQLLGSAPALLLHGGGAPALLPHLPEAMHTPALVLEGLARWARL
jgi:type III pantothenate kinase